MTPTILDKDGERLSVGDRVIAKTRFVAEYEPDGSPRSYEPVEGTVVRFRRMCLEVAFEGVTRNGRPRGVHALDVDLMWRCPDLQLAAQRMKTTVYLRVAKKPGSPKPKVAVGLKANQRPLEDSNGQILPTTCFALALDIPEAAFQSAARVVAELSVPEDRLEIAAEVLERVEDQPREEVA